MGVQFVKTMKFIQCFILIVGTTGSLGGEPGGGGDGVGEILNRIEVQLQEDAARINNLEKKSAEDKVTIEKLEKIIEELKETQDADECCRAGNTKTIEEDVHRNTEHIEEINKKMESFEDIVANVFVTLGGVEATIVGI